MFLIKTTVQFALAIIHGEIQADTKKAVGSMAKGKDQYNGTMN
ncbi:hypothetical protein [Pectinatus cerevisiiphilus]|nr:hypothetical protein [Pectinatus cerevisiiphilus]